MQKKDILEASNAYVLGSYINPKFVGTAIVSFESGATWANEQNAAEIARWQAIADDLQAKRVGDAAEIARLRAEKDELTNALELAKNHLKSVVNAVVNHGVIPSVFLAAQVEGFEKLLKRYEK